MKDVLALSEQKGAGLTLTPAEALLGVVAFAKGEMARGMSMLNEVGGVWRERRAVMRMATFEAILGSLYLNLVASQSPVSLRMVARNIGFLARNMPNSAASAETHFKEAARLCEQTGAVGSQGEAYLGLAQLYEATRKSDRARECAQEATRCFTQAGIKTYLAQAHDLLESLG